MNTGISAENCILDANLLNSKSSSNLCSVTQIPHVKIMAKPQVYTFLYAIIISTFSLVSASGSDTLAANQSIGYGQTLISKNQVFELGFFSPGASPYNFLGIRYKNTPDVVPWVANTADRIADPQELSLILTLNGALVITNGGRNIWWTNSSLAASNSSPIMQLLDTGNLVIVDESDPAKYLWQSFDFPTDTKLPGMKIVSGDHDSETDGGKFLTSWRNSDDPSPGDFTFRIVNHGLPELVIFEGEKILYRTGPWNGVYFSGFPFPATEAFKPELVFTDDDKLTSAVEAYNSSVVYRAVMEPSGQVRRYSMNDRRDEWQLLHTLPRDPCDNYAQCGTYGICNTDNEQICSCLEGFISREQQDWDRSSGCVRMKALKCSNGDVFQEVKGAKFPDMLDFKLNTSISRLGECEAECLRNCNCTAYANAFITSEGTGCLMWFGDLFDMRHVRGADNRHVIFIRVAELTSTVTSTNEKKKDSVPKKLIIALVVTGVCISCLIVLGILLKRRVSRTKPENLELPLFKFEALATATNNFSSDSMIGEGGFGSVYKGKSSTGEEIAVKRLSKTSIQGLDEFKTEVILIAKLQHRNLVRLLGCCIKGDEKLLVYEYMQNRSLDCFVFDENRRKLLTWPKRFNIIMGIARGLLYLHHDSRLNIIHRDLKTSNILLDGNLNPKISDFGLARTFGGDQTISKTDRVMGTYGYMAPEYAIDGKFSIKSDIFSLGVLLLEIVSGKKNRGFSHYNHHHTLLGHAWILWKEDKALELMDECLKDTCVESELKRCIQVSLLCVQKFPESRPVMSSVLFMLGSEGAIIPYPQEPGFFMERSTDPERSVLSIHSSQNSMTVTALGPR